LGTGVDLLKLLEPAVRPAGLAGPTAKPSTAIENRSFESMLDEAQAQPIGGQAGGAGGAGVPWSFVAAPTGL
jgi:hypothetical protein